MTNEVIVPNVINGRVGDDQGNRIKETLQEYLLRVLNAAKTMFGLEDAEKPTAWTIRLLPDRQRSFSIYAAPIDEDRTSLPGMGDYDNELIVVGVAPEMFEEYLKQHLEETKDTESKVHILGPTELYTPSENELAWLDRNFSHHPPLPGQIERYEMIRKVAKAFADYIMHTVPMGHDRLEALRSVRAAVMFANAGIAVGEVTKRPNWVTEEDIKKSLEPIQKKIDEYALQFPPKPEPEEENPEEPVDISLN